MSSAAAAAPDRDPAATGPARPTPGDQAARARDAVREALAASDAALGAWEAGSAAFGRADAQSDLDVGVLCTPGAGEQVLDAIEEALRAISNDLDVWHVGRSAFGVQRFWQPRPPLETAPICMVDVSVMEHEAEAELWRELLTVERHGGAIPLHDRDGVLAAAIATARFDADAHRTRIATELDRIRARHAMFRSFGAKELARGRVLDAHWIHQGMVVNPLVALLGMRYRPLRFDFGMRYLHEELPDDVVECLVPVVSPIGGPTELPRAIEAGIGWIDRLLTELDPASLPLEQHAAQMRAAFAPTAAS